MIKNEIIKLQKEITLKYVTALVLIAILSTLAFYTLHTVLKESDNTGEIVNISGKQRMLSQHIALDIYRIYNGENNLSSPYKGTLALQILKSHTQEMSDANKKLSLGNLSNNKTYTLSVPISEMYFGDMNLAQRVDEYIKIAEQFFVPQEQMNAKKLLSQIDILSEPLLRDLNKVVHQYQKEGEEKLSYMQTIETAAWIMTIFVLLLEVIFIFQPMVRKIISLTSDNYFVLQHLEDTVEIRTMHLEKANDKLEHLAFHDPLTGLKNRLNLEQDIEQAIEKSRNHNSSYAVLMFDIDWFKSVNDNYGHDIGDMVIKELSGVLLSAVREEDKVYRAGGEEFVILLNRIDYKDAACIAEKIRLLVQKHIFKVNDKEFSKTISCGLFHSSLVEANEVKSVLKLVDIALYRSKTAGRNKVSDVQKGQ